jgi:L-alanine-DL-glutamate epimerase-like enolase superfamily enzyme
MKNKNQSDKIETPSGAKENRRDFVKKASLGTLGLGLLLNKSPGENEKSNFSGSKRSDSKIIITDLKCAVIGHHPVVRITTNQGISGYSQLEPPKNWIKPYVLFYKDFIVGMDPTDIQRIMLKIRRLGGFKPWGAAVSAIEVALWDIAGKAAGLPVYKLMGGKVRDRVRAYGRNTKGPEGFDIVKMSVGFHSRMPMDVENFFYGTPQLSPPMHRQEPNPYGYDPVTKTWNSKAAPWPNRGPLTEIGLKAIINAVEKRKKELGDSVGLAVDCGPGFMLSDAIKVVRALEPYNLMWAEDIITGDYTPYVMADLYRELTTSTSTPIHTGEQIYLRENFRELIETNAVNVVGPDPLDMGGIAEMKWVAEYADLHSIMMAPHGVGDGVFGLAAQVHAGATMPENFIAFEYPRMWDDFWLDITEGLPDPLIVDGLIEVWDRPGLGIDFIVKKAKKYLPVEDSDFFD